MNIDLNLGELAKPVDTLIREVLKGVSALSEGTLRRWNEKRDLIHAINMCKIIEKAHAKASQAKSVSLGVEGGFLLNFLDKCKTVSDADMQDLWASILAKESDIPGSFSQLTINSLENFRKQDAEWFISFCSFVCEINSETIPLIGNVSHEVYTKNGISIEVLEHLCALNVIEIDNSFIGSRGRTKPLTPYLNLGESISIFYFDKKLDYVNEGKNKTSMNLGNITFTSIGKELLSICDYKQVDGFIEYLKREWRWSTMFGDRWRVEGNKIIRT
ncbi:MAG: DUF2806 domain-containing protein [Candidatus Poribacteria bacterium]|nr:DUF2806 domain-containing protein [Candidatus Poribacteria bacterium]